MTDLEDVSSEVAVFATPSAARSAFSHVRTNVKACTVWLNGGLEGKSFQAKQMTAATTVSGADEALLLTVTTGVPDMVDVPPARSVWVIARRGDAVVALTTTWPGNQDRGILAFTDLQRLASAQLARNR